MQLYIWAITKTCSTSTLVASRSMTPGKTRRWIWIAAFLIIAGGGGYLLRKRLSTPTGPKFETTTVDRGPITAKVTATGTLSALVTVQVGTQVSGRIDKILVDFNSTV